MNGNHYRSCVTFDEQGVRHSSESSDGTSYSADVKWNDVQQITAYKRDCLTFDLICLAIADSDGVIEIDEDAKGYKELVHALPNYLPGCESQGTWFSSVAFPPFGANERKIYERL